MLSAFAPSHHPSLPPAGPSVPSVSVPFECTVWLAFRLAPPTVAAKEDTWPASLGHLPPSVAVNAKAE
jgi:hypothetical protein